MPTFFRYIAGLSVVLTVATAQEPQPPPEPTRSPLIAPHEIPPASALTPAPADSTQTPTAPTEPPPPPTLLMAAKEGRVDWVAGALTDGRAINLYTGYPDAWALRVACAYGHLPVVEALVAAGVPVSQEAFLAAAGGGQVEVMAWLLEHGADLEMDGRAAFDLAYGRYPAVIAWLQERGVGYPEHPYWRASLVSRAVRATRPGDPASWRYIRELHDAGFSLQAHPNVGPPLYYALRRNDVELVRFLLDLGAGPLDASLFNMAMRSPKHIAVIRVLLEAGVPPNPQPPIEPWTTYPLDLARRRNLLVIAGALIDAGAVSRADATVADAATDDAPDDDTGDATPADDDDDGPSPMDMDVDTQILVWRVHRHLDRGEFTEARALLAAASDAARAMMISYLADRMANAESVDVLVDHGLELTGRALFLALGQGDDAVALRLLEAGVDPGSTHWTSPLIHIPLIRQDAAWIQRLLDAGATPPDDVFWHLAQDDEAAVRRVTASDPARLNRPSFAFRLTPQGSAQADTPLRFAALLDRRWLIPMLAEWSPRWVVDTRAMEIALEHGHLDFARDLVRHGFDLRPGSSALRECLVAAIDSGRVDALEFVLSSGGDPHMTLARRELRSGEVRYATTMTAAAAAGHVAIVDALVSRGGDIREADDMPLSAAIEHGHLAVAQRLVALGAAWHPRADGYLALAAARGDADLLAFLLADAVPADTRTALLPALTHAAADQPAVLAILQRYR